MLDEYMSRVCLDYTMGEVVTLRESAANAREFFVASLIYNAVFDMDIDCIRQIVYRIDGTVPVQGHRDDYANLLGDAIEDVMEYTDARMLTIFPEDKPIIAMAKVLLYASTESVGTNYQKRKDRSLASQMILDRTGGKKAGPTRPQLETKYTEPKWMTAGEGNDR